MGSEVSTEADGGKVNLGSKAEQEHDPFADYRVPTFQAAAPGQGSKFVEWQMDLGKCSSLLHSMWLLGGASTDSDKSNDNIYVGPTAISRMTQADINKCAENLPPSYYAKRNANGDVNYLAFQKSTPDFPNPLTHPFSTLFFGPGIAVIKAYENTKHLFKDDASITIKDGHALYQVPGWYDLQDGSNKVKVRLAK